MSYYQTMYGSDDLNTQFTVYLTCEEIETIRIHMNAFKEKLCNQGRWNEAMEYQRIVDKLDGLLHAERKEE